MSFHRICFAQPWSSPGNEAFWLFRGGWTPERQQDLFCEHFTAIVTKRDEFKKDMWNAFKSIHFTGNNLNMMFLLGPFWNLVDKSESNSFDTNPNSVFELMFEAVIGWLADILTKQSFLSHASVYSAYPVWLCLTVMHWHWFKSTDFGFWKEWAALEQRNLKNRWSPPEDSTALLALEAAGYQDMHECKPKLKHESST